MYLDLIEISPKPPLRGNGGNGSRWYGTAGGIGGTGNGSGGHREKANVKAQGGASVYPSQF
jgi:hypothetical protein